MVYIQVYIPDKNRNYDFKISSSITVIMLKSLIIEAVYNVRYDEEFIKKAYLFMNFYTEKMLKDNMKISDYAIHNGEKFLLV